MIAPTAGESIILYDGVCGLCDRLNQFVLKRDDAEQFRYAALQSRFAKSLLAKHGRPTEDLNTFYLVEDYGLPSERLLARSRAALRMLDRLGGVWRVARAVAWLPTTWLDAGYGLIARSRYRIFGKSETCRVPSPTCRTRFIEYE